MNLTLITAPTVAAVSLVEAKAHLRVTDSGDDTLIAAMVQAATEAAEQMTGRALMTQTWQAACDAMPDAFTLTRVPVQSVTSVTYLDADGVVQTLSALLYQLSKSEQGFASIVPAYNAVWPESRGDVDGVKVRYVAGYADAASVPQSIKSWILLQTGAMYENRESEVVGNGSAVKLGFADRLLDRFKVYG